MYENHRKDITLQTMITFEACYMQANIAFFTSYRSFHVTVAAFRLSTLRYYPMLVNITPNVLYNIFLRFSRIPFSGGLP